MSRCLWCLDHRSPLPGFRRTPDLVPHALTPRGSGTDSGVPAATHPTPSASFSPSLVWSRRDTSDSTLPGETGGAQNGRRGEHKT